MLDRALDTSKLRDKYVRVLERNIRGHEEMTWALNTLRRLFACVDVSSPSKSVLCKLCETLSTALNFPGAAIAYQLDTRSVGYGFQWGSYGMEEKINTALDTPEIDLEIAKESDSKEKQPSWESKAAWRLIQYDLDRGLRAKLFLLSPSPQLPPKVSVLIQLLQPFLKQLLLNMERSRVLEKANRELTASKIEIQKQIDRVVEEKAKLTVANRNLDQIAAELRNSNQELEQFVFVASHDLQEPLRQLIAFSKLLPMDIGGDLPKAAAKDLHFISRAAQRMSALVKAFVNLSETFGTSMNWEAVCLDECVDHALETLAQRIEETGAEITRDALPEVDGDATLLVQLYQDLIGNALKFVPAGRRPVVNLTAEQASEQWILGVQDNGIGLATEDCDRIFAPFKRLHNREDYEGTGIGLSICQKIVQRHRGTIMVESAPEQGAYFKFTLPRRQLESSENGTTGPRTPQARTLVVTAMGQQPMIEEALAARQAVTSPNRSKMQGH